MIEVRGLCFSYEGENYVLKDIDIKIQKGEIVTLLGPNGCGKTTLLKCMNALLEPVKGQVLFAGREIRELKRHEIAKHIAYVPQEHKTSFPYTVLDVVLLGRVPYIGLFSTPGKPDIDTASDVLKSIGIYHLKDRIYTHISGGERKLCLIARALCSGAEVLLLDEPTSNLDLKHQTDLLRIIRHLSSSKRQTVLMTIHDPNLAMLVSDRVIMMKNGSIVVDGKPKDVLIKQLIKHTYDCDVDIVNENNEGYIKVKL